MEDKSLTFNEWIFEVAENIAKIKRKDVTDIYVCLDLYEAKLAFLDGLSYDEYKPI